MIDIGAQLDGQSLTSVVSEGNGLIASDEVGALPRQKSGLTPSMGRA